VAAISRRLAEECSLPPAKVQQIYLAGLLHDLDFEYTKEQPDIHTKETLKLLEGLIDIYMPDMKYSDPAAAKEFSAAADYPQVNRGAVKEMHHQVGDLQVERGLATRGLLIRHLVLPNNLAGSSEIMDFLAEQISTATVINVMDQYRPCYKAFEHSKINRRPTRDEIESVREYAIEKGLSVLP